jgi:RHS repeat-associated protein
MVTYQYDAWGNGINKASASNGTDLGNTLLLVNPFIYKGYYYDKETDWYYLKSRYYCPKISRFIGEIYSSKLAFHKSRIIVSKSKNSELSNGLSLSKYNLISQPIQFQRSKISSLNMSGSTNDRQINVITNSLINFKPHFIEGLYIGGEGDLPSGLSANGFYVKGNLGWSYTVNEGLSYASIEVGALEVTYSTPEVLNTSLNVGVEAFAASASVGNGFRVSARLISGSVGVDLSDSLSVNATGYVGFGLTLDFSNGIKFGGAAGVGLEFSINFEWWWE